MGDGENLARRLVCISTLTLTNVIFSHCIHKEMNIYLTQLRYLMLLCYCNNNNAWKMNTKYIV